MQNFPNLLVKYSTCFGQVHCPSSGVSQHCIHAIGICHVSSVGCLLALADSFITTRHVFSIVAFCIQIYRTGRKLSWFKLSCNLFEMICVLDSPSGIIQVVFSCCILISSSFKSVYFWSFPVTVLWSLWLLGIAASTECVALMVLSSINMCDPLLWIFRSVVMDLSQYSSEFKFSNTVFLNRRTARVSPGICHFNFLRIFHE